MRILQGCMGVSPWYILFLSATHTRSYRFLLPWLINRSGEVEDGDKIMGLSVADDYITKPFNPLEVVARVKAQLRQYMRYRQPQIKQEDECSEYDIRGMTISKKSHKCILFGKELQLTPTEFSILWYLCENQGKVVSTEELFEVVWGEKTVWGVGYTIEILDKTREEIVEIQAALW